MRTLVQEVEGNFEQFSKTWQEDLSQVITDLKTFDDKFLESYKRLVSLQAWRMALLDSAISPDSLSFFLEAQNDALTSHVLARMGSWRASLKSLRSCVENVLYCMYYKDHPVELRLWEEGKHRLGFSEATNYFERHPDLVHLPDTLKCLASLTAEHATLSRAVHGSAKSFRMTGATNQPRLWHSEKASVGAWGTREKATLTNINCLLITLFYSELQGTKLPNLRKSISLCLPPDKQAAVKAQFKITLYKAP